MAGQIFNVIFSGKLVEGTRPPEVLARLCRVLDLEDPQVRELFKGGAGAVILKDLDGRTAYDMRDRLREAGAICTVQEVPLPVEPVTPSGVRSAAVTSRLAERHRPVQQSARPALQQPLRPQKQSVANFSLVFKVVVFVALCGGGWWGYQQWFAPPSPAYQVYTQYAEAMAREQYQQAADVSSGQAKEYVDSRTAMMAPTSMKVYGRSFTMLKPSISSIAGEVSWIKRKRKSEEQKGADAVALSVEETVCRIPPGVASAFCKWPVTFHHDVEMSLVDGTWKVTSFKEERLTPQQ